MYEPHVIYTNIPEAKNEGKIKKKKNQQKCAITSKKCNISSFLVMITLNSLDAILFLKSIKQVIRKNSNPTVVSFIK